MTPDAPRRFARIGFPLLAATALVSSLLAGSAAAETCSGPPRKINVGVSVSPPNVVHTTAYVAKELGLFAKHCLDVNIIQFDGGSSPAASVALTQGNTFATVSDVQVGRGMKVKQVWGLAPKAPQAYVVSEGIKGFGDLKGKRLSAAGGGVGSFNWRIGREALSKANLTVDNAQFISQGTAGRLAGLVAGQIDAVSLHPEDAYLAMKQKPGLSILTQVADLMPLYSFNSYGVSTDTIAKDRQAVVDFIAAMVEANRVDLPGQGQGDPDHGRGDAEAARGRRIRLGLAHQELHLVGQRGLRARAHAVDHRPRRCSRRHRRRQEAGRRPGDGPEDRKRRRRRRRRPRGHPRLQAVRPCDTFGRHSIHCHRPA